MKILALSDRVEPQIYKPSIRERFHDVDIIVGCGDLPVYYLDYVVTQLNVPLVYVPGNHDPDMMHVPGGQSIDGKVVKLKGKLIAGFGGSRRYKPKGNHQYTEAEMRWRTLSMFPKMLYMRLLHGRWIDVLVTHAPPLGIHDASDPAHVGFASFRTFIRTFRPALMLHGHSHAIRNLEMTQSQLHGCSIVNIYPFRVVDLPEAT